MRLRLRSVTGQNFEAELPDDATVRDLHHKVQEELSVPPEQQRLIFSGRELTESQRTLSSYSIRDESIVHLVVRRGAPQIQQLHQPSAPDESVVVSMPSGEEQQRASAAAAFSGDEAYEIYNISRLVMVFAILDFVSFVKAKSDGFSFSCSSQEYQHLSY
jgi:hypothetical protein